MESEHRHVPPEGRVTTPGHGIHSGLMTVAEARRAFRPPDDRQRVTAQQVAREILNRDDRR